MALAERSRCRCCMLPTKLPYTHMHLPYKYAPLVCCHSTYLHNTHENSASILYASTYLHNTHASILYAQWHQMPAAWRDTCVSYPDCFMPPPFKPGTIIQCGTPSSTILMPAVLEKGRGRGACVVYGRAHAWPWSCSTVRRSMSCLTASLLSLVLCLAS